MVIQSVGYLSYCGAKKKLLLRAFRGCTCTARRPLELNLHSRYTLTSPSIPDKNHHYP